MSPAKLPDVDLKTIPNYFYYIVSVSISLTIVFSFIFDEPLSVGVNLVWLILICSLWIPIWKGLLTAKIGITIILTYGSLEQHVIVYRDIFTQNIANYNYSFLNILLAVFIGFAICVGLSRKIGLTVNIIAVINTILLKSLQPDPNQLYYVVVFPMVVLVVSFTVYIFRRNQDKYIYWLYGTNSPKPIINLYDLKLTNAEWRCIAYLKEFKSTKEIAGLEKCSESAIQARLGSIYTKLKVLDRPGLLFFLGNNSVHWTADDSAVPIKEESSK